MRRHRNTGRTCLAGLLYMLALLASGCTTDAEYMSPASEETEPISPGETLLPVALPDLSRVEEAVQAQLSEPYELLIQRRDTAGTPALELGKAYGEMGKLLMAAKYLALAEPYFLNAQALAPLDRRWPYYLGHLYKTQGELAQAKVCFQQAVELRPDDAATLIWLGEVHLLEGRSADAARVFARAIAVQPRSLAARFGLGRSALAQHDYAGAVTHLEETLALSAQAVNVHYPLALAYRGLGEIGKAEAHLRQRGDFEILPADPLMQELRDVGLQSAVSYEIQGTRALNGADWNTAVAQFRRGLALEPSNPTLRHQLGTALYMLGEAGAAQEAFEEVVRASPEFVRAHYSLGLLLESDGRYPEAIERYLAALAHDPGYVEARVRLAGLLRWTGRLREAITHYDQVLAVDPRLPEASLGRAMALVRLQQYGEARERLREAARVHPDNPWFAHALARLLAAAPDDRVRDGRQALAVMNPLSDEQQRLDLGETMAMVLSEVERYDEAVAWQRDAMEAARRAGRADLAQRMAGDLRLYESGRPSRTPWRDEDMP